MMEKINAWLAHAKLASPHLIAREILIAILVTASFVLSFRSIDLTENAPSGGFEVGVYSPADPYDVGGYEHDPTYFDNPPAPATSDTVVGKPVDDPSIHPRPETPIINCATTSGNPPACQKQEVPDNKKR